ncbi:hypothetical protein LTR66_013491 [Elasticomyces elasticus]|nr:hypothetical protein LTR66_013491 [Elasticomyces elasticus]
MPVLNTMRTSFFLTLAAIGSAIAQRPANTSICDYYTTALFGNSNATNEYSLLVALVNTVVIGNYTKPNVGVRVPGILTPGLYNGVLSDILPFFNGALASSNRGGSSGVAINFLDDGGAAPLMKSMPAYTTTSNQYKLMTHLYQFFGSLLGCSAYGSTGFPAYSGSASMASVHRFMDLDPTDLGYFIAQVALAAASFGVADTDVAAVGAALQSLFGYRCAPPTTVIAAQGAQLQSVCEDDTCPLAPNATCAAYPAITPAMDANATGAATASMGTGVGAMTVTWNETCGCHMTQPASNASFSVNMSPTSTMSSASATATGSMTQASNAGVGMREGLGALALAIAGVAFVL